VELIIHAEATKAHMITGIKDLLTGVNSCDVLVFTNSSHGTYIADTSGDEPSYDEAMCPYDVANAVLVDDELRELCAELPRGVRLTVISDSCFSGTVTRAIVSEVLSGLLKTPDDRRVRFLNPALRGGTVLPNPWQAQPKRQQCAESKMREVLLSGCTDKEYSYDALVGGVYHGAMTYYALQAIRPANYQITYAQLHSRMNYLLDEAGYPQHPQLEGRSQNKKRQIFF
jgi:metacaspase-1